MAAEGQSKTVASDMEACIKQRCGTEFIYAEKMAPTDIHRQWLSISGDRTVDVSTVRLWVVYCSSSNSDMKDKPCSGWPYTAVTTE